MRPTTIPACDVPNFAAFDKRLRDGSWHIAMVGGVHRDSDALDQSNARVLAARLREVDPDGLAHEYSRASHWAVGWYEHLIVRPDNAAVMAVLAEAAADLESYPALDEDDWSELEWEQHEDNLCHSNCDRPHCDGCGDALHTDNATHCDKCADESDGT